MQIGVVIVEDDPRYRRSLEALFAEEPGFFLAGSFDSPGPFLRTAEKAARRGAEPQWDIVLMDIELPEMSGIEATRRVKKILPGVAVVTLTVFEEPATILQAICAGSDGYLLKKTPVPEMLSLLRAVLAGGSPLTSDVARSVLGLLRRSGGDGTTRPAETAPSRLDLSEREQEVLRGLVQGFSYKQVGAEMNVSIDTVRTYIRRIYQKLRVHSVAEAVSRAIHEGLV